MSGRGERQSGVIDRLSARVTRRGLTKGGGLMLAGATLGQVHLLRAAAQSTLEVAQAVNAAITLEAFSVTFYGVGRSKGSQSELDENTARFARASQCEEEAHFHFFEAAGAIPSTNTFTIDDARVTTQKGLLSAVDEIEGIKIGFYMAAGRLFAANSDARLMEIAFQIGAVEAQHQAIARLLNGTRIPGDRAFAQWRFRDPAEAVDALQQLGYIKGDGSPYAFPGPVDRNCRGVMGLVPETTEDQPPDITPVPQATPVNG